MVQKQLYQAIPMQVQDVDERAVFLKFELFAKRLNKLIDMFTTIHQFSSLEQHTHISGKQKCRYLRCCCCENEQTELTKHKLTNTSRGESRCITSMSTWAICSHE